MSIKDRLSKKTADLMVPTKQESATPASSAPLRTGPGQMLMVNSLMRESNERVSQLEARLKQFEGALPVRFLDPSLIVPSKWANRVEDSFVSPEFVLLKEEIRDAGGNVQPIKVRSIPSQEGRYEIVYGHRRHRACSELGLPVLALIDAVSDQDLFKEMERENRTRSDLSPWEQGRMYRRALKEQLFSSQEHLARELGIDPGNLSKALRLADIDEDVVKAFNSPLDLQFRFAKPLSDALQRDPEGVVERALTLARDQDNKKRSPKEILQRLVGVDAKTAIVPSASLSVDSRFKIVSHGGVTSVEINSAQLSSEKLQKLQNFLESLFSP